MSDPLLADPRVRIDGRYVTEKGAQRGSPIPDGIREARAPFIQASDRVCKGGRDPRTPPINKIKPGQVRKPETQRKSLGNPRASAGCDRCFACFLHLPPLSLSLSLSLFFYAIYFFAHLVQLARGDTHRINRLSL